MKLGGAPETKDVFLMRGLRENEPDGIDGFLGIAALNASRVEFDFEKGTLRWQLARLKESRVHPARSCYC